MPNTHIAFVQERLCHLPNQFSRNPKPEINKKQAFLLHNYFLVGFTSIFVSNTKMIKINTTHAHSVHFHPSWKFQKMVSSLR